MHDPAVAPVVPSPPAAYQPYPPQTDHDGHSRPRQSTARRNSLSHCVVGLVLSVGLIGLVASVLAIIFARIANRTISKTGQRGKGLALAAIIVGLAVATTSAVVLVVPAQ